MIAFLKLNVIAPMIHHMRFARFGVQRFVGHSRGTVDTRHGRVTYYVPNARSFGRTVTLYSKEPETIEWIDSFGDRETFWDIGANIGIYSIYAAANPSRQVVAFEPSAASFAALCRSIELNTMDERVSAYCIALSDEKKLSRLNMRWTDAGFAGSSLDVQHTHGGEEFEPSARHAVMAYSVDVFISEFSPPFPNHIKIDVDGNDHLVLEGARRTLADLRLKSVLVELVGGERYQAGVELLTAAGFGLDPSSAKARRNRIFRR